MANEGFLMARQSYAVVGATGKIGNVIVHYLLKKGHRVHAIGRHPQKLQDLKNCGADIFAMERFDQPAAYDHSFKGVDAAFLMIPPGYDQNNLEEYQDRVGEALFQSAEKASLSHIINLSSLGAHLSENMGPIKGLFRQEQRLNGLASSIMHLRPSYFFDNLLGTIPTLHRTGFLKTLLNAELAIPMVSTEDIGIKAAEFLDLLNFSAKSAYEFVGPRPLTMPEAARIIGQAIKKEVKYLQASVDETKKEMLTWGFKPKTVELMIEMYLAFNQGKCLPVQKLTADQRGKITFEEFVAKTFIKAYTPA